MDTQHDDGQAYTPPPLRAPEGSDETDPATLLYEVRNLRQTVEFCAHELVKLRKRVKQLELIRSQLEEARNDTA